MTLAYIHVVVLLHVAFAGVFFFLFRQSASRFARLFAASWLIEAVRAAILLPDLRGLGGSPEHWFAVSDGLCLVANWWLLTGCAALAGVRLPRWLGPVYFWSGLPVVWFNRYFLPQVVTAATGVPSERVRFYAIAINLVIIFVPVAVARGAVTMWLFEVWRKLRLPGALVAAVFCVPYAVVALAVPFQFYFTWNPDGIALLWCARVLGFSIGMVVLMLDLQQQQRAKSEANLAAAQALAKIGSWETNLTTGTTSWSAEMFRLYGREPGAGAMTLAEFLAAVHPRDRDAFQRNAAEGISARRTLEQEFRIIRPDGTVRWVHGRNTPQFDAAGALVAQIGVEQDITDRKRAEARAALQHGVTRALADASSLEDALATILQIVARGLEAEFAAFWTVDRSRQVLRCAQWWHAAETPLAEFVEQTRTHEFRAGRGLPGRLLAEREPVVVDRLELVDAERYPRRDAATRGGLRSACGFPILLRAENFGAVEFFTAEAMRTEPELLRLFSALGTQIGQFIERQRLEEQYRQSQKMEAVGTLAGGIAHDFNNILTAVSGYCELAQFETPPESPAGPHLQAVRDGARRAAELVRQIMAFSRQQAPQRQPLLLSSVVSEAMKLMRATIPATVEIVTDYAEDLPAVLADATSIHQIVVNLCTNACHAMRDRTARLEVAVATLMVDGDYAVAHPGLRVGRYVLLTVADTGTGMDAATVARIFEPFFTTKGPGEGTGLGLAVVHGIVQSHDGGIFVYSRPGEGTRIMVYFPVHGGDAIVEPAVPDDVPRGRGERVLYVDDEVALGRMGRQMLEKLGYSPEVHDGPAAALAALEARPDEFDAVVTDLTMPGMNGLELARRVRRIRGDLPIILMSGYTASLTPEKFREMGVREFLMKPHSLGALGKALQRALGGSAGN